MRDGGLAGQDLRSTLYLSPERWRAFTEFSALLGETVWREDIFAWFNEVGFRPAVIDYTDVVVLVFANDREATLFKLRWM